MRILTLIFFIYASMLWGQQPEITFEIKPTTLSIGDSAAMKWDIRHADQAYLLNMGKIPLSGSQKISPQNNTAITIIAEGVHGIASKTISIEVIGARGEEGFPSKDKFKAKRAYTLSALSFIDILKHIHNVLQDYLEFQVNETYDRHSGKTTFLTRLSTKPELVQSKESKKRARRIAYLVEVNEARSSSQEFPYTIDACIEYQRRSELRWRPEKDEKIYTNEIKKLHDLISQAFD